jgi:hypothetical protein
MTPPLCFASVLKFLQVLCLNRSLHIEATDSQVPYQRLYNRHATSMPDVTRPELRFLSDLSQGIVETLVSTPVTFIDTSSMVHLHSSQLFIPDGILSAFSLDAHHNRSLRMQLRVVWYLRLIVDTEGPTLITGTACLHSFLLFRLLGTPTTSLTTTATLASRE